MSILIHLYNPDSWHQSRFQITCRNIAPCILEALHQVIQNSIVPQILLCHWLKSRVYKWFQSFKFGTQQITQYFYSQR